MKRNIAVLVSNAVQSLIFGCSILCIHIRMNGRCGDKVVTVEKNAIHGIFGTLSSVKKILKILPVLWRTEKTQY